jgi:hypothetical protein
VIRPASLARWTGGLLLAVSVASCASSSEPKSVAPSIPTGGDTASLKALTGRWEGTYTNPVNGRTGAIVLEFFSGKEAHGDILMLPPGSSQSAPSPEQALRTMPQVYEINFIQAEGDVLSGTVGPYEDPQTHCSAHSTFQGKLQGDSIEGTFRTECVDTRGQPDPKTPASGGTWKVTRKKS